MPTYTPDEFARVLLNAVPKAARETVAVVKRGALNVKNEGRRNSVASSGRSARMAPQAIGFDQVRVDDDGTIWAAVEYQGAGQANLGTLLEFGGGRDHSPPHHDLRRALESEEPRFEQALADVAEKAIE